MLMHHNQNEFLGRFFFLLNQYLHTHTHTALVTLLANGAAIMDGLFVFPLQSPIFRLTILPRNSFMKSDKQGLDLSGWYHVLKFLFLFPEKKLQSWYKTGEYKC